MGKFNPKKEDIRDVICDVIRFYSYSIAFHSLYIH